MARLSRHLAVTVVLLALLFCAFTLWALPCSSAELLIMARSNTNADATISARECWKLGDLVMVAEDGFKWGKDDLIPPEKGGAFYIVKVPMLSVVEAKKYYGAQRDVDGKTILLRSKCKVRVDAVSAETQAAMTKDGSLSTTFESLKPLIYDKVLGEAVK